jgi:hypothetical protein
MFNFLVGGTAGLVSGYFVARAIEARSNGIPVGLAFTHPLTPMRALAVATAVAAQLPPGVAVDPAVAAAAGRTRTGAGAF